MLRLRVITGAVGVPLIGLAIWFGAPWFSILMAAAAVAGTLEFYRLGGLDKRDPLLYLGVLWALGLLLSPLYRSPGTLALAVTTGLVVSALWTLCRRSRENALRDWAWTVAGALYVGWMLSYWLDLRGLEDGRNWVLLAILTIFANDTGAFFIGRRFGRHKMAPRISPAKTWEGAVAGLVSAVVGALIVALGLSRFLSFHLTLWQIPFVALLISLFAQLGDLVESLLKRNMGAKESGTLLPGHGGILDRFDSLLLVGPVLYYFTTWIA